MYCQGESYATGRSLVQRSPTDCVSLSLIRCNLNLECVDERVQTKKKNIWQMRVTCLWYFCKYIYDQLFMYDYARIVTP
jgi:hypothetical protein